MSETYLVHHGIMGQKWGVRRFQNEDGSLTEAGRRRLSNYKTRESAQVEGKYSRRIARAEKRVSKAEESGNEKRLNRATEKRDRLISRRDLEQNYINNVTLDQIHGENVRVGANVATSLLVSAGSAALATLTPVTGGWYAISVPNLSATKENYRRQQMGAERLRRFEHSAIR